jgi:hypothetical protein
MQLAHICTAAMNSDAGTQNTEIIIAHIFITSVLESVSFTGALFGSLYSIVKYCHKKNKLVFQNVF